MPSQSGRKNRGDTLLRQLINKERVRALNSQKLPAHEMKQLGDLYLQKGDHRRAIEYLYGAADELSANHMSMALALYKKILNINPGEMRACERIVSVLSAEGLAAEQIKYLMILAEYHAKKNDIEKTVSVYRRILDLDPGNTAAMHYFTRWKTDR